MGKIGLYPNDNKHNNHELCACIFLQDSMED